MAARDGGGYPKIRGSIVPADIFDEVTNQLAAYRAEQATK